MEKLFSCHDGCLAPVIAKRNENKKWILFNISEVQGMGMAEYKNRITDIEYDDLIAMNSFSGVSYICTKVNNKWGLIEIKDNQTPQCEWKVLCENKYDSLEALLSDMKINKEDFRDY